MEINSLKTFVQIIKDIEEKEWVDDATADYKRGFEKAITMIKFELFGKILENYEKNKN